MSVKDQNQTNQGTSIPTTVPVETDRSRDLINVPIQDLTTLNEGVDDKFTTKSSGKSIQE